MSIYTSPVSEIQDLVEQPVEREWLELKSWVDLTDPATRANMARHLAAISNYGGGYLVFGFKRRHAELAENNVRRFYGHDVLAGIIDRYLHPKFQCEVSFPEFFGIEHAVIWIPPHGMSPVISKADGPQDARGEPRRVFAPASSTSEHQNPRACKRQRRSTGRSLSSVASWRGVMRWSRCSRQLCRGVRALQSKSATTRVKSFQSGIAPRNARRFRKLPGRG